MAPTTPTSMSTTTIYIAFSQDISPAKRTESQQLTEEMNARSPNRGKKNCVSVDRVSAWWCQHRRPHSANCELWTQSDSNSETAFFASAEYIYSTWIPRETCTLLNDTCACHANDPDEKSKQNLIRNTPANAAIISRSAVTKASLISERCAVRVLRRGKFTLHDHR